MADLPAPELPPKNHNNPPSETEYLEENLTLRNVHAIRAAQGHIEMAANIPDHFNEEVEASFTSDLIKLMENCTKELERRRKEEKEPFLRQGQCVDYFFNNIKDSLATSIAKAKKPLGDWLQRKAAKEQADRDADAKMLREQQEAAMREAANLDRTKVTHEEAERVVQHAINTSQIANVAESIAAAPVTSMARTTTKISTAGLATKWVGTITDVDQLDLNKIRPYISRSELDKAVDRYVKQGGRACDGVLIKEAIEMKVK